MTQTMTPRDRPALSTVRTPYHKTVTVLTTTKIWSLDTKTVNCKVTLTLTLNGK